MGSISKRQHSTILTTFYFLTMQAATRGSKGEHIFINSKNAGIFNLPPEIGGNSVCYLPTRQQYEKSQRFVLQTMWHQKPDYLRDLYF